MINKINRLVELRKKKLAIDEEMNFIKKEMTKYLMLYGKSKGNDCLTYEINMPDDTRYECEIYLDLGKYNKDKRIRCEWEDIN